MGSVSKCNSNPCCGDPAFCVEPPQFERPAPANPDAKITGADGLTPRYKSMWKYEKRSAPYGSKQAEYERTAEMFIQMALGRFSTGGNGPYYALALLLDIGYERKDMQQILNIMQNMPGAIK